jgi:hypothetical protein
VNAHPVFDTVLPELEAVLAIVRGKHFEHALLQPVSLAQGGEFGFDNLPRRSVAPLTTFELLAEAHQKQRGPPLPRQLGLAPRFARGLPFG